MLPTWHAYLFVKSIHDNDTLVNKDPHICKTLNSKHIEHAIELLRKKLTKNNAAWIEILPTIS